MIEFRNIAVCYAPHVRYPVFALDDVSLHIGSGEWVFFVGPSGAGKSTLLKLVYKVATAHRGQVWVDGRDITHLPHREIPFLRRKVGVIFQDFQLLPQKTVWENVAFAQQVIGTPQKQLVRDVPRAIETVGLTHKADARPHQLSGGEQQRVAIARAIVNRPTILLADEPTGNLDPQTARDIAEVLQRINEDGTTILMATHDRFLVDTMRKRVVRIAGGRIVSDEAQGVYHPEDDVPQRDPRDDETLNAQLAVTALDGTLLDLLVPEPVGIDPDREIEQQVEEILSSAASTEEALEHEAETVSAENTSLDEGDAEENDADEAAVTEDEASEEEAELLEEETADLPSPDASPEPEISQHPEALPQPEASPDLGTLDPDFIEEAALQTEPTLPDALPEPARPVVRVAAPSVTEVQYTRNGYIEPSKVPPPKTRVP